MLRKIHVHVLEFVINDTSFQHCTLHGVETFYRQQFGPTVISTHYNFIPSQFQANENSTH